MQCDRYAATTVKQGAGVGGHARTWLRGRRAGEDRQSDTKSCGLRAEPHGSVALSAIKNRTVRQATPSPHFVIADNGG